jgi:hypothetical protein
MFYELFHCAQHLSRNVKKPNINCHTNLKMFVTMFWFLFVFLSWRGLKKIINL